MITISIIGLDQFVVAKYSLEHTKPLANLFETPMDNLNFYAPNCSFYHAGIDQTSWNTLVRVHAPKQYEALEDKISKYLLSTLAEFSINIAIEFFYYLPRNRHEFVNPEYPRFMTHENIVDIEHDDEDEDDEIDDEEEIYDGNVFAGIEDKIK